jgi:hypothetical protein
MISAFMLSEIAVLPVFLSTVTPGKFPTFWLRPVKQLNKEVLPLLGFPTKAICIFSFDTLRGAKLGSFNCRVFTVSGRFRKLGKV